MTYDAAWFTQRQAELDQRLADLHPTPEQLAESERSLVNLQRIIGELDATIRAINNPIRHLAE